MSAVAVAHYIEELESRGGLEGKDIGNITDTSDVTVSGWRMGKIKPEPKDELILADLGHVVDRLSNFFTAREIRAWLHAGHPQLDGARAIDAVRERRALEVMNVIGRLDSEVFL